MTLVILRKRNGPDHPALGRCVCGEELYLTDPLDNFCDCGRIYNMSGTQVTKPSYQVDYLDAGERYDEDY